MVFGKCSECLAIETDVGLLHRAHEFGVGNACLARCGIDAERENLAVLSFLFLATTERMHTGVLNGFFGSALFCRTIQPVTFCLRKDVLAALILHRTSFDACHRLGIRKEAAFCRVVHDAVERIGAMMALFFAARTFRVEMILARRAGKYLALFRDTQALTV